MLYQIFKLRKKSESKLFYLKVRYLFFLSILLPVVLIISECSQQENSSPKYAVTCLPLKYILMEIIGNEEDIEVLVDAGYSPHTFSPSPSVIRKMENAKVIFYVEENYDKWFIKKRYNNLKEVFKLLPESFILRYEENHIHDQSASHVHNDSEGQVDPHFWTDPLAVKTIVPEITQILIDTEPEKAEILRENAEKFMDKLSQLDQKISDMLEPIKGTEVFLLHPSFNYLLKRYGLIYAGSIEESPGKEPTPKFLSDLIARIKKTQTKSIFTEPQLSDKSAQSIAESAGLKIFVLDPLGGIDERNNYFNLMLYNAQVLLKALSN